MHRERSPAAAAYVAAAVIIVLVLAAAGMLVAYLWHPSPLVWLCAFPVVFFCLGWVFMFLWMARTVA